MNIRQRGNKEKVPLLSLKEIKPEVYVNSPGLTACAGARTRERWLKRKIAAAVKDAVIAFHGTKSDERLWANFAWKCGYRNLLEAIYQGEAEMAEHETPLPDGDKPKVLQTILNKMWKRGAK